MFAGKTAKLVLARKGQGRRGAESKERPRQERREEGREGGMKGREGGEGGREAGRGGKEGEDVQY